MFLSCETVGDQGDGDCSNERDIYCNEKKVGEAGCTFGLQEGNIVQGHVAVDELEDHHFGLVDSTCRFAQAPDQVTSMFHP